MWGGFIWFGKGQVAGSCEHGDVPACSVVTELVSYLPSSESGPSRIVEVTGLHSCREKGCTHCFQLSFYSIQEH
jgi:hypothetical protein